jgi:hypothetical protein
VETKRQTEQAPTKESAFARGLAFILSQAAQQDQYRLPPWRLPAQARGDLRQILGSRQAGVIGQIEQDVSFLARMHPRHPRPIAKWRALCRAVRSVQTALADLSTRDRDCLASSYGLDWIFRHDSGEPPPLELARVEQLASEIERLTDSLLRKAKRPPHRPRGSGLTFQRSYVTYVVAKHLDAQGVKLTKGRDGLLAKTAEIVLDATGLGMPAEMFPVLQGAFELMRRHTEPDACSLAPVG